MAPMIRSGPITRPAKEFVSRERNPWLDVTVKLSGMFAPNLLNRPIWLQLRLQQR